MSTRVVLAIALAAASVIGTGARVVAHHAFAAEFDGTKPITLKGKVTRMEWINPHAWLYLDVKMPNGKIVNWGVEGGAPNALLRRGWNKTSVLPGTEVTVEGFRAKDGSNRANGRQVTLPDGKRLFIGSSGTGAPLDGRDPTEQKK